MFRSYGWHRPLPMILLNNEVNNAEGIPPDCCLHVLHRRIEHISFQGINSVFVKGFQLQVNVLCSDGSSIQYTRFTRPGGSGVVIVIATLRKLPHGIPTICVMWYVFACTSKHMARIQTPDSYFLSGSSGSAGYSDPMMRKPREWRGYFPGAQLVRRGWLRRVHRKK